MSTASAQEAIEFVTEVCDRADALGVGLAKFPVDMIRELLVLARRKSLAVVPASEASDA